MIRLFATRLRAPHVLRERCRPLCVSCFRLPLCWPWSPGNPGPAARSGGRSAEDAAGAAVRGSIVEDRAAKKLLEAGDARLEADEATKAVEIWKSVIERYPRSKHRFDAHMRLGNYFLDRERAYDRARVHFEAVAAEDNRDEEQRAEATLKMGVCFYRRPQLRQVLSGACAT